MAPEESKEDVHESDEVYFKRIQRESERRLVELASGRPVSMGDALESTYAGTLSTSGMIAGVAERTLGMQKSLTTSVADLRLLHARLDALTAPRGLATLGLLVVASNALAALVILGLVWVGRYIAARLEASTELLDAIVIAVVVGALGWAVRILLRQLRRILKDTSPSR